MTCLVWIRASRHVVDSIEDLKVGHGEEEEEEEGEEKRQEEE